QPLPRLYRHRHHPADPADAPRSDFRLEILGKARDRHRHFRAGGLRRGVLRLLTARFHIKEGVQLCLLDPRLEAQLPTICRIYEQYAGFPPTITCGREGTHLPNSLHYEGRAIDLRTRDLSASQKLEIRAALAERLGPDWDIVLEADHMHVE